MSTAKMEIQRGQLLKKNKFERKKKNYKHFGVKISNIQLFRYKFFNKQTYLFKSSMKKNQILTLKKIWATEE